MTQVLSLLHILAIASLIHLSHEATGDPTLSKDTVTDKHGNSANANNTILWANVSAISQPYQTDLSYNDNGLGAFYDMTNGFIKLIQPQGFPTELMTLVFNDISAVTNDINLLVNFMLGTAICLALGVLFMLCMPLVGCCMCCCRTCCNKCGGRKIQRDSRHRRCKRTTFTVLGFVCTVFIIMGFACMLANNEQITVAIEHLAPTIENNLKDMPLFINNTVAEMNLVALGGIKFTMDVLTRDLKSLGFLLGVPTRDALKSGLNLDAVLKSVEDFESVIGSVGSAMRTVNTSITTVTADGDTLVTELADVATDVDAAKTACGCGGGSADTSQLTMDVDFSRLPDISGNMALLEDVQSQDLSQNVNEGRQEFEDIPWTVQNETQNLADDITSSVDNVYDDIDAALTSLKDIEKQTSDFVTPIEDSISDQLGSATDLDQYRWLAMLGLPCLIGLIGVLQLFGLLCGALGTMKDPPPTERGCVGNCGGNLLMAATGLVFIFSWLLMLLLILFFLPGSNLYSLVCGPLTDPDLKIMDFIEGKNGVIQKNGYILSNLLFGNASIELPVKGVLKSCRQNEAAMTALKLYHTFDINTALDWRQHVDISNEINNINVDFTSVNILTPAMEKQLRDFADAVTLDYQGFVDELEKNTTMTDLGAFSSELRTLETASPGNGFIEAADKLDAMTAPNGIYDKVSTGQAQLLTDIRALNTSTRSVNGSVENLLKSVRDLDVFLQTNGTDTVKQEAKALQNRLEKVVDSFVNYANTSIFNDIGRCKPITNLYDSMISIAICKYTVDSFNGYWFAMGTSIFFMLPSVIFNVKLAKHFRRMKYKEELDDPEVDPVDKIAYPDSDPPIFASNKVAPQWY